MTRKQQRTAPGHGAPPPGRATTGPLDGAALATSLAATLARWNGHDPLWVFGYGSLIWKPELHYDARVPARIFGYHRRLCLRSVRYRGTVERPGLVAGLDRGGSCAGVAFRLPAAGLRDQFAALWEREMFLGSYDPRWLRARRIDTGAPVRALAFVVRHDAPNYCGALAHDDLLAVLDGACGVYGTSLDYLERTVAALQAEGLRDPHLERLLQAARERCRAAAVRHRPPHPGESP